MLVKLCGRTHDVEVIRQRREGVFMCICPLCADHSGHLEIDLGDGIWFCHRHQGGGVLRNKQRSKRDAKREKQALKNVPKVQPLFGLAACRRLKVDDKEFQYLAHRPMPIRAINDLDPRLVAPGWVSVPHFLPDRSFLGFIHRRAGNDLSYKYRYTPELFRSPWGLHRFKGDEMVLVEGAYDAAGDERAVALLGIRPTREALTMILSRSLKRLVVALDGDAYDAARMLARTVSKLRKLLEIRVAKLDADPDKVGIQHCIKVSERFI